MNEVNSLRQLGLAFKGEVKKGNLYSVPLDMLEEEEGHNARDYDDPETIQHIENLAAAYFDGETLPPLHVKVIGGRVLVRDGHCRRRGALLAVKRGAPIDRMQVLPWEGDEIDDTLLILKSNDGLKLKSLQRAAMYKRLSVWGKTDEEIAKYLNVSATHVRQQIDLLSLPMAIKDMLVAGEVAATEALNCYKKNGPIAVEILANALTTAKSVGKKKVTKKLLSSTKKRIPPKMVERATLSISTLAQGLESQIPPGVSDDQVIDIKISASELHALLELNHDIQEMLSPKEAS